MSHPRITPAEFFHAQVHTGVKVSDYWPHSYDPDWYYVGRPSNVPALVKRLAPDMDDAAAVLVEVLHNGKRSLYILIIFSVTFYSPHTAIEQFFTYREQAEEVNNWYYAVILYNPDIEVPPLGFAPRDLTIIAYLNECPPDLCVFELIPATTVYMEKLVSSVLLAVLSAMYNTTPGLTAEQNNFNRIKRVFLDTYKVLFDYAPNRLPSPNGFLHWGMNNYAIKATAFKRLGLYYKDISLPTTTAFEQAVLSAVAKKDVDPTAPPSRKQLKFVPSPEEEEEDEYNPFVDYKRKMINKYN